MSLAKFDDFLGHQRQVSHVSETHILFLLRFITPLLTSNYLLSNPSGFEKVKCEKSVVTSIHWSIEDLLNNIIHHIVQEIVPRKTEEKALDKPVSSNES